MAHPATRPSRHGILTPRSYHPGGYAPAAFKETNTTNGDHVTGYLTGWEADNTVQRAADRRTPLTVCTYGIIRIQGRHGRTALTLLPVVHPQKLTARQYTDLELIDRAGTDARVLRDPDGTPSAVDAGFSRIPYTQTSILLGRGWLSQVPHTDQVWVSTAGRMAMAFRWHAQQQLPAGVLKGLYLDGVLTAADATRARFRETAPGGEEATGY
ncbi:hypothetical protein OG897_32385 [Streptomyces sp. NBC_00237]|uniref:hypothetical protein n=1 Tax=Streptomyces sp. NBC_00237 TaxID=2975687 RepID=UPI0022592812|nr:hypothetical protein [Streptomyces sp. NBC_00237]MCX5206097.1 hypothetical protein [Streptomyces sp. NBC_00237]